MRHLFNKYRIILKCLSDGKYHSGNELGEILNTSRTTIRKYINELVNFGVDIYIVRGKGYSLPYSIELLDEDLINQGTGGVHTKLFDMIDSTNSYMLTYLDTFHKGSCILAETQTHGVGRSGTTWISPFGCQIILSMYWEFNRAITGLSLAVGLATVKVLEQFGIKNIGLKWPNDIYVNQKKLAGILIESRTTQNNGFKVVIGTGINVITSNSLSNQKDISAITLDQVCNKYISRNELAIKLINEYRKLFSYFEKHGFSLLRSEWNSHDIFYGCEIKLVDKISGKTIANGIERGVNDIGSLIIENPKGMQETFLIGDLSLRL